MRKGSLGVILAVGAFLIACAPEAPATDPVARGRQLSGQLGCPSCHEASFLNLWRPVGPPLDHIGTVADTRRQGLPGPEYLRQSIADPGAYVVPGYPDSMPRGLGDRLSSEELADLVQYLSTLR